MTKILVIILVVASTSFARMKLNEIVIDGSQYFEPSASVVLMNGGRNMVTTSYSNLVVWNTDSKKVENEFDLRGKISEPPFIFGNKNYKESVFAFTGYEILKFNINSGVQEFYHSFNLDLPKMMTTKVEFSPSGNRLIWVQNQGMLDSPKKPRAFVHTIDTKTGEVLSSVELDSKDARVTTLVISKDERNIIINRSAMNGDTTLINVEKGDILKQITHSDRYLPAYYFLNGDTLRYAKFEYNRQPFYNNASHSLFNPNPLDKTLEQLDTWTGMRTTYKHKTGNFGKIVSLPDVDLVAALSCEGAGDEYHTRVTFWQLGQSEILSEYVIPISCYGYWSNIDPFSHSGDNGLLALQSRFDPAIYMWEVKESK